VVAEIVDVHDVLVADLVDRLGLGHEARDDFGVARKLGVDRLHGDLAPDDRVLGQVNDPHASLTKLGGKHVVTDRLADRDHDICC
jgi:hypothetical protein